MDLAREPTRSSSTARIEASRRACDATRRSKLETVARRQNGYTSTPATVTTMARHGEAAEDPADDDRHGQSEAQKVDEGGP